MPQKGEGRVTAPKGPKEPFPPPSPSPKGGGPKKEKDKA
jgi:hypothetical protein